MDRLDRSPRPGGFGRSVKASVVSSGGASHNSPFKKVRSDINLDRSESPDMAKRLSRPKFDQLNDTDLNNNSGLSRVHTMNVVDG